MRRNTGVKGKLGPEAKMQIALVKWFRLQYPKYKKSLIRIGNEGRRSVQGHTNAIKAGMVPGASDLFLAVPSGPYYGFWMELKAKPLTMSERQTEHVRRQQDFINEMIALGYHGDFVCGLNEGIDKIKTYLNLKHKEI